MMTRSSQIGFAVAALLALISTPAFAKTTFNAHLTGKNEVPVRETRANGQALFTLSSDGTTMQYKIILSNIENVVSVRLENGAAGATGPEIAVLYGPAAPGGGKVNGQFATGTLAAANLVGPLAGRTIADLVTEIQAGRVYVNVVTDDGVGPTNEKPGDFSSGEIRGQLD
jgi:hypothetical protein